LEFFWYTKKRLKKRGRQIFIGRLEVEFFRVRLFLVSFALFCKRSGIALHITEEDANPLFAGYQKDWYLVLVN